MATLLPLIPPLDPAGWDLDPEPDEFTPAELEAQPEIEDLEAEVDRLVVELAAAASLDLGSLTDEPLAAASSALDEIQPAADVGRLDEVITAAEDVDALILGALDEAPAEAFAPLPDPFEPPTEVGGFETGPEEMPAPGFPVSQVPITAFVTLANVTRPGATEFLVGDEYRLDIRGDPNRVVSVTAWRDGVDPVTWDYGITDGVGGFTLSARMEAGDEGWWNEIWYVGQVAAYPQLRFLVTDTVVTSLPLLIAPSVGQATVRLTNLTRRAASDFEVGEQFEIDIVGPAAAPVSVTAERASQPASTSLVGITNARGGFTLVGRMTRFEIGAWTEVWQVADIIATPILRFSVREARPAPPPLPPPLRESRLGAGPAPQLEPPTFTLPSPIFIAGIGWIAPPPLEPPPPPVPIPVTYRWTNQTRPTETRWFTGDSIFEFFTGAPATPVFLEIFQDSVETPRVFKGWSDGAGNFSFHFTVTTNMVGRWTYVARIAGVRSAPTEIEILPDEFFESRLIAQQQEFGLGLAPEPEAPAVTLAPPGIEVKFPPGA